MDGATDGWKDRQLKEWMEERAAGWLEGWRAGRLEGWLDGEMMEAGTGLTDGVMDR